MRPDAAQTDVFNGDWAEKEIRSVSDKDFVPRISLFSGAPAGGA